MNFFKSILSFLNRPTIEIDWNPYLATDESNNLIVCSPKGFKVNVFTDVDFAFFEFNKYHFCIKKDSTVSDWEAILKIINETKIFHLNLESINDFFINYGYKDSEDIYIPIPFFLKKEFKKIYRTFKNQKYYEIDFLSKKILKDVYKIKINNQTTKNKTIGYFIQDWFFKVSNLSNFSKSIMVSNNFSFPMFLKKNSLNKNIDYGVSNKVSSIVNHITDVIDLESVKTLTSYGLTFSLVNFNNNKALIGITNKTGYDPVDLFLKKDSDYTRKTNKKTKYFKYHVIFEDNQLKLIHHSEKEEAIEFSEYKFVIYYFIGNKIVRDVLKTREKDIEEYQYFIFSNLNRDKLFEKYPSTSILKELVDNGIISIDQKPVIEDLNLLEMMKI